VLDAEGIQALTTSDGTFGDYEPAWSPDGRHIAFVSNRELPYENIYLMEADGTDIRKLTDSRGVSRPTWSPDGTRIAFNGMLSGQGYWQLDIFVIDVNGTGIVTLTNSVSDEFGPSWSPDGRKIAFASWEGICTINADGSDRRVIVPNEHWFYNDPTWSPDGQRIAFTGQNGQIYSVNADGSGFARLTHLHVSAVLDPSWAPDGRRIAFSDNEFIYILDLESGSASRLLRGSDPDWHK